MKAEGLARGAVARSVWANYTRSLGGAALAQLMVLYAAQQGFVVSASWWLTRWAAAAPACGAARGSTSTGCYVGVYVGLSLMGALLIFVRLVMVAVVTIRAGRALHERALVGVCGSPVAFFDTTPLGRIINRFSSDLQTIDVQLRMVTQMLLLSLFSIGGALGAIAVASPYVLLAAAPLCFVYVRVARHYRASSRELRRLESASASPLYAALDEALAGTPTIRAFGATERLQRESEARLDANARASFARAAASRWLGVRLEFLGNCVLGTCACLAVASTLWSHAQPADGGPLSGGDGGDGSGGGGGGGGGGNGGGGHAQHAGLAGLALSYAITITGALSMLVNNFATLEISMVNAERLFEFAGLPPEEKGGGGGGDGIKAAADGTVVAAASAASAPDAAWPSDGRVVFDGVWMRYRPGLPPVLCGVSLEVRAGEKVGICGRTGAGKSSLLVALFRLAELEHGGGGAIFIDGVDVASVPLSRLRGALAIIPQDPTLFSGTLRSNLDPLERHADAELLTALEQCHLLHLAQDAAAGGLTRAIDERGANLSTGQRQLVCIGRALLRRGRVLVLDEATASVDLETDSLIQTTLRSQLEGTSVLSIAHRLETIMHCDRVVVMDGGRAVESGPPLELRDTPGGRFAELCASRND